MKKALASPLTTRAGGADRGGAPGQSEAKGGGRRVEEWRGTGVH